MNTITFNPQSQDDVQRIANANHDEWLKNRSNKDGHVVFGGSDAAACVGLNPYKSRIALWAEKTGVTEPFSGNRATRRGAWDEEWVAKEFELETGKKVRRETATLWNSRYPFMVANIDRVIVGEKYLGKKVGLEIKTTDSLNLHKFKNGEFPVTYYCQVMHYMIVTGMRKFYLAVCVGQQDLRIFEIYYDEDEAKALIDAEYEMFICCEEETAPEPDGSDSSFAALKAIYHDPFEPSEPTEINGQVLREYLLHKEIVKQESKIVDELEAKMIAALGNSTWGSAPGYKITYKESSRSSFDKKSLLRDHPEISEAQYTTTSTYRRFSVTAKKEK